MLFVYFSWLIHRIYLDISHQIYSTLASDVVVCWIKFQAQHASRKSGFANLVPKVDFGRRWPQTAKKIMHLITQHWANAEIRLTVAMVTSGNNRRQVGMTIQLLAQSATEIHTISTMGDSTVHVLLVIGRRDNKDFQLSGSEGRKNKRYERQSGSPQASRQSSCVMPTIDSLLNNLSSTASLYFVTFSDLGETEHH